MINDDDLIRLFLIAGIVFFVADAICSARSWFDD